MEELFANRPKEFCKHCKKCGEDCGFIKNYFEKPPEDCAYEGWFFMEWEKYKQNIRKLKEKILVLKVQLKNCNNPKKSLKIAQDIKKTEDKIKSFETIGPTDL